MRLYDAKMIREDSKAMKGIVRVHREDVAPTVAYVASIAHVPIGDLRLIGSARKSSTSGDIDLAVNSIAHSALQIHHNLLEALGDENARYNSGTNVGSYAVPVGGIGPERVQVDIMYVENLHWAEFAYFSAGDKSKYKGAVRTILLSAVASSIDEPGIDAFLHDDGELVVRVGRGIDLSTGMKRLFQMRPKRKNGKGYLARLQRVSPEEIKKAYPNLEFEDHEMVVDDPAEVVKLLFGEGTRPENVETAEQVLDLISRFPKARQDKIFDIAKIRAKQLVQKGMELPEELQT